MLQEDSMIIRENLETDQGLLNDDDPSELIGLSKDEQAKCQELYATFSSLAKEQINGELVKTLQMIGENIDEEEIRKTISEIDSSKKGLSGLEQLQQVIAVHKKKHNLSEDDVIFALVMSTSNYLENLPSPKRYTNTAQAYLKNDIRTKNSNSSSHNSNQPQSKSALVFADVQKDLSNNEVETPIISKNKAQEFKRRQTMIVREQSDGSQSDEDEETESELSDDEQEDDIEEAKDDGEPGTGQQLPKGGKEQKGQSKSKSYQEQLAEPLKDSKDDIDQLNAQLKSGRELRSTIDGQTDRDFKQYEKFLEEICSHKQILNVDKKLKIEDPKQLEKSLRQGFVKERKHKLNNISSYQITIDHFFDRFLKDGRQGFEKLREQEGDNIREETYELLEKSIREEENSQNSSFDQEDFQPLDNSILSVDVDHYSIDKHNIFMIVKTVESIATIPDADESEAKQEVIYTVVKIYKEQEVIVKERLKNLKTQASNVAFSDNASFSSKMKSQKSDDNASQNSKSKKGGDDDRSSQGSKTKGAEENPDVKESIKTVRRYKIYKEFLVSETGIITQEDWHNDVNSFIQPTSVIYNGQSMYFFRSRDQIAVLCKADLQSVPELDDDSKVIQIQKLYKYHYRHKNDSKYAVYFVEDGTSRGKQLNFTEQEITALDSQSAQFIRAQCIQVVDMSFSRNQIYALKDLENPIIDAVIPEGNTVEVFLRAFYLNRGKKRGRMFVSLFDSQYYLNVIGEPQNNHSQQVFDYNKHQIKMAPVQPPKQIPAKRELEHMEQKGQQKTRINQQVKCIQKAQVLKYDREGRSEKKDLESYFTQQEQGQDEENENDQAQTPGGAETTESKNQQVGVKYFTEVFFFIDENGFVQLLNISKDLLEQANLEKTPDNKQRMARMIEYYRSHIMAKIGYPVDSLHQDEQVRVTYMTDKVTYDDPRYPGHGLIDLEDMIPTSAEFGSFQEQCKNTNYIVASFDSLQYLYAFKHIKSDTNEDGENNNASNDEYKFDVIKINNLKLRGNSKSDQVQKIIKFLNRFRQYNLKYVPPVRLNKRFRNVISNWFCIQHKPNEYFDLLSYQTRHPKQESHEVESRALFMNVELSNGEYIRVRICDFAVVQAIHRQIRAQTKLKSWEVSMVPLTYYTNGSKYLFVFEISCKLTLSGNIYSFSADNFLIQFQEDELIKLSEANVHNMIDVANQSVGALIDERSSKRVRYLRRNDISSGKNIAKSQVLYLTGENESDLKDYELGEQFYTKTRFQKEAKSMVLVFQQVVDSKRAQNLVPFIAFESNMEVETADKDDATANSKSSNQDYSNFSIQVLIWEETGSFSVSRSKFVSPNQKLRSSLEDWRSISLWRTSDIFHGAKEAGNDEYLAHYQISFIYQQDITRSQFWEYQLKIDAKTQKIVCNKIGLKEKLISSLKALEYSERCEIADRKYYKQYKKLQMKHPKQMKKINYAQFQKDGNLPSNAGFAEGHKIYLDFQRDQQKYKYYPVAIAARGALIPEFDDEGLIKNPRFYDGDPEKSLDKFLNPVSQGYKSPYMTFGYEKSQGREPRTFDITLQSKLSIDCILQNIFTPYEVDQLLVKIVDTMLRMKPVLIKDFGMLLMSSYQNYLPQVQKNDSFFQPQELFKGQSMLDLYLNEPAQVTRQLNKFYKHQLQKQEKDLQGTVWINQELGSTVDMILQNHPYSDQIFTSDQLECGETKILSQDFLFKSQIVRCLENKLNNSLKLILEKIFQLNSDTYQNYIENDFNMILDQPKVQFFDDFLQVQTTAQDVDDDSEAVTACNMELLIEGPIKSHMAENKFTLNSLQEDKVENQKEEISQLLRENYDESQDNHYEVKHFAINFQNVQLGEKIRKIQTYIIEKIQESDDGESEEVVIEDEQIVNEPLSDFQYVFGNLELAERIAFSGLNVQLYELSTIQKMIDIQFELLTKVFFKKQLICYTIGFLIPYTLLNLGINNRWVNLVLIVFCSITQCGFFGIELIQLNALGLIYFQSFFNLFDTLQFIVFFYQVYSRGGAEGYHSALEESEQLEEDNTRYVIDVFTKVILVLQIALKYQNFMRIVEDFGFLGQMVTLTVIDMSYFLFYFIFFVALFTWINYTLHLVVARDQYPGLEHNVALVIMTFRNSIGNVVPPDHQVWIGEKEELDSNLKLVFVGIIWGIWVTQVIFMIVTLLNFLIAIINQTYERVYGKKVVYVYTDKAELNKEYFQIIEQVAQFREKIKCSCLKTKDGAKLSKSLQFMVMTVSSDSLNEEQKGSDWFGFVHQIKRYIEVKNVRQEEEFRLLKANLKHVHHQTNKQRKQGEELRKQVDTLVDEFSKMGDKFKTMSDGLITIIKNNPTAKFS